MTLPVAVLMSMVTKVIPSLVMAVQHQEMASSLPKKVSLMMTSCLIGIYDFPDYKTFNFRKKEKMPLSPHYRGEAKNINREK